MTVLYLPDGEGPFATGGKGKRTTFKVTGDRTGDRFGLFEHYMPPGSGGASLHFHKEMIETFYVLEGELLFDLGDRKQLGSPGDTIFVPEYTPHGFWVVSDVLAKMLMMFCPMKDREKYFEGLQELAAGGRVPGGDELTELMHRFDQYPLA